MTKCREITPKTQIEFFISQFRGSEDVFLYGMCYWFSFILQERFKCGEIIHDPIAGHFLWVYENTAYDVTGGHELPKVYETLSDLMLGDPRRYLHLYRDCVLKPY